MLLAFYVTNYLDPDGDGILGLPEDDLNKIVEQHFDNQQRLDDAFKKKYGSSFLPAPGDLFERSAA